MPRQENKVKYNIKNVHIAKRTEEDGVVSYGTPFKVPGAVSISLEAQGELTPFYADGVAYYTVSTNSGYEGDLVLAMIPDRFRTEIMGETLDDNGVMIENAFAEPSEFAMGFEIDGDKSSVKFWFLNCKATRPAVAAQTNEESKEPNTDTLALSCAANGNGVVRTKTTPTTEDDTYNNWYKNVYVPVLA